MKEIEENEKLMRIFELEDPNSIAETIVEEMNIILEELAPSKVIQLNNRSQPWQTTETKQLIKEADESLGNAVKYNEVISWRLYKRAKNKATKWMETAKRMFFIERLSKTKNLWKELKEFKGKEDETVPVKIVEGEKEVASSKKLASMFN